MATATNSRRDLYASSEPRPKDSTKKRPASPHKKSPMHKNTTKRPKKELSQEEISLLTYQSISLLLDAARMLDEAEKKATAKAAPPPKPVARPPVKVTTPPSTSVAPAPAPIPIPVPVAPQVVPPRSPAKLIYDDTPSSSSIAAAAALTLLTESPPRTAVAPEPVLLPPPQVPQAVSVVRAPYPAYRVVQAMPRHAAPTRVVAPISRECAQWPHSFPVPYAAIPMTSPAIPLLRPLAHPAHPDTLVPMMPRSAAIPIPAELADIAVPVAPRSVPSMPRVKATRRPQKSHLPPATKRKAKIPMELDPVKNFGYPDECRTRVPKAVLRYIAQKEKRERERQDSFFADYYWK